MSYISVVEKTEEASTINEVIVKPSNADLNRIRHTNNLDRNRISRTDDINRIRRPDDRKRIRSTDKHNRISSTNDLNLISSNDDRISSSTVTIQQTQVKSFFLY